MSKRPPLPLSSTGENNFYYLYTDYQGNLQTITNGDGNIVKRYAFDPWGRRRNPDTWKNLTYDEIMTETFIFDRGYTGHEHLDAFGLINMNGRIYDPYVGRFLSPDPLVQQPYNSQNHNRYSYAINNPLRYTDPSGYSYKPIYWSKGSGTTYINYQAFASFSRNTPHGYGNFTSATTGYNYNWNSGEYYNDKGERVTYGEVFYNYVLPNSEDITGKVMFTINSGSKDITIYTGEGSTEVFDTKALNTRIQETVALMNSFNSFLESLFPVRDYGMSLGGPGDPPTLIPNSDVYWGITGMSWLWAASAFLSNSDFMFDTPSVEAGKFVGKIGVGLNVAATIAEGYDLINNWDQAGNGDIAKFGVDVTITTITTVLYFSGVGAPFAVLLTGVQIANTLGAFDFIYESINESEYKDDGP